MSPATTCRVPQGWPAPRAAPRGRQPQAPWCRARPSDKAAGARSTEPLVAREHVSSKRARSRGFPTAGGRGRSGCVSSSDRCAPDAPPPNGARDAPRRHSRAGAPFAHGSLTAFLVDKALRSLPACNGGEGPSTPPQSRESDSQVQGAQDRALTALKSWLLLLQANRSEGLAGPAR